MCDIHIGVPQGSVLGPILFILYVNDINQHMHIGDACNLYADDTRVYCSANNVDTLQECTNNDVACIKQWYDMNTLVENTAKSNATGLYRDVWIAAIASSRTSLATLTGVMCNMSQCELRSVRVIREC